MGKSQGPAGWINAKKELAEKVASKVGEPPFTVVVNEGKINPASTLRARVFVDVNKPLVRFVPITIKKSKKYPVFYDKLPVFCYFCGLIGHTVEECGDGTHELDSCEWGEWLLWSNEGFGPGMEGRGGREGGGLGGRTGGRGARGIDKEEEEVGLLEGGLGRMFFMQKEKSISIKSRLRVKRLPVRGWLQLTAQSAYEGRSYRTWLVKWLIQYCCWRTPREAQVEG